MRLTLKGRSRHGHNVIQNHGAEWIVLDTRDSVFALRGMPGRLLISVQDGDTRWIRQGTDPDFEVTENEDSRSQPQAG